MRRWASHIGSLLRRGLPVLAVYALLLQAFLAGAAPARALDPAGAPLCSDMAAGAQRPAPVHAPAGGHDCLCLSQCAAPHAPPALTGGEVFWLPQREAALAPRPDASEDIPHIHPRHRGPGARAPPRG